MHRAANQSILGEHGFFRYAPWRLAQWRRTVAAQTRFLYSAGRPASPKALVDLQDQLASRAQAEHVKCWYILAGPGLSVQEGGKLQKLLPITSERWGTHYQLYQLLR